MYYKIFSIIIGFIIGFLINFIIYGFSNKTLKIFNKLAIKNKKLTFSICILNSILYFLISYFFVFSLYAILCFILFSSLLALAIIDLKIGIVPDSINLFLFFIAIVSLFITKNSYIYHIIGFFLVSLPFLIIGLLTGGIGGGDIKLFAVTGLFLGSLHIFLAMFIACFLASIFGIILKYLNKTDLENNKASIPLVPYISVGVIFSILFGDKLLNWYFTSFFL